MNSLFNGCALIDIVGKFKHHLKIDISGGSGSKRHLLSPLASRLNYYLLTMFAFNVKLINRTIMLDNVDKY